jgi:hypothetical protein
LMSQVVEMLSRNIRLNEKELTAPGFFTDSGESSSKKGSTSGLEVSLLPLDSHPFMRLWIQSPTFIN